MRGDRVEVVVDTGDGTTTFDIVATKAGRRVEVSNSRGVIEVSELTRSGNVVRSGRFMATRVVAVVEHPAIDRSSNDGEERSTRSRKKPPENQESLL